MGGTQTTTFQGNPTKIAISMIISLGIFRANKGKIDNR